MSKYSIKIIDQKVEMEGDAKDEYQIRTKNGDVQEVEFEEFKKDESESKEPVKLQYRVKKDGESKFGDWQDFESKAKWTGGWVANGMKFINKDLGGAKMKKEVEPGLGFFRTPTYTCWGGIVVIFIAIIVLIWWWIASSNKEDKEEESL